MPPSRPGRKNVPDPKSSAEGQKLLDYKKMLKKVQKELPEADARNAEEKERNLETLKNDLDVVLKGVKDPRNKSKRDQFLDSQDAVVEKVDEAIGEVEVMLSLFDDLRQERIEVKDKPVAVRELRKSRNKCSDALEEALGQFLI
ncbi:MAG TPA: hypothetical protein VFA09_21930 [Ktedonobacteraceae bacterium]|nr:hypothetical protein [Ktedonobacteraceae bacterium]